MTTYTHTTFEEAVASVLTSLGDTNGVFYTSAEVNDAVREVLRMWNAFTGHHRVRGSVTVTEGIPYYDLAVSLVDPSSNLLRERTITAGDVAEEIFAHLVEETSLLGTHTEMFSTAQVLSALEASRDRFIAETAINVTYSYIAVPGGVSGVVELNEADMFVRRAVWLDSEEKYHPLEPSDERTTLFSDAASIPQTYSIASLAPLSLQLHPPPSDRGTLILWTTRSGGTLTSSTVIAVPDDLVWAVKWGAVADLLSVDGPASDPQRAEFAQQMFDLGVQVAIHLPVILNAYLNGAQVVPSAIATTDRLRGGWEGYKRGVPDTLSVLSPEYVFVTPVPNSSPRSLSFDVVRSAPVPGDTDYTMPLQVGREHLPVLLGLARMICMFKLGGPEFAAATTELQSFRDAVGRYASNRSAYSTMLQRMLGTSTINTLAFPVAKEPVAMGGPTPEEVLSERNARRRRVRLPE